MKHSPHLKLALLLLLLLPLAAMAQTYIITGSGTSFTATKGGTAVAGATNVAITSVITAIRTDANGANVEIQFGDGESTLDIGSASATINGTWGVVTISGAITNSTRANIDYSTIIANISNLTSKADITNTTGIAITHRNSGTLAIIGGTISGAHSAIYNNAAGTIDISGGTLSSSVIVVYGENGIINVSGGTISSTTTMYNAVSLNSTGKITISGTANITSATTSTTNGTITVSNSANLEIIGGTITNTSTGTNRNAIYNNSTGSVLLGGNPDITGTIGKSATAGNLSLIKGSDNETDFNPTDGKIYNINFATNEPNSVAIVNGAEFSANFVSLNNDYSLMVKGSDLILGAEGFIYELIGGVYVITKSDTKGVGSGIQEVINSIRTAANGADCEIQFGDGESRLDIRTASATFENAEGGSWGEVTINGKITNIVDGTAAIIVNGPNLNSKADIMKTGSNEYAIRNNGTGTVTIISGTIGAPRYAVVNSSSGTITIISGTIIAPRYAVVNSSSGTVNISGGDISASNGSSIFNNSTGTINISGGDISAMDAAVTNASTGKITISGNANITSITSDATSGTILIASAAGTNTRLEITGGTIRNAAGGNAVYNASTSSILLGGSPNITGNIRKAGTGNLSAITDPDIGTVFAPATDYTLDFDTYAADGIAVENGKNFLGYFKVANNEWGLIASGNDLVIATAVEAQSACETEGNTYVGGVCKTALQIAQEECEADDSKVWENGECNDITPIRHPQIASSQISVKAINGAIVLENLPKNARVEVYNLEGKRLRSNNPENLKTLRIMVQTKGIYIVKINHAAYRIAVM